MVMRFGLFVFFFRVTRDPLAFIPFGGLLKVGPCVACSDIYIDHGDIPRTNANKVDAASKNVTAPYNKLLLN